MERGSHNINVLIHICTVQDQSFNALRPTWGESPEGS